MPRHHSRHHSNKPSRRFSFVRFITSSIFKISGIILLLAAVLYALFSLEFSFSFDDILAKLFEPAGNIQAATTASDGDFDATLIYYFLPGMLVLGLAWFLAKRSGFLANLLSLVTVIFFIALQTKILAYDAYVGGSVYPDLLTACIFLVVTMAGLFINALLVKKPVILILTSVYFYLSMILFVTMYGLHLNYLLPLVILFTMSVAWSSGKIKNQTINLVNFILALGFFGLFWLRKLVVNEQVEYLLPFFIYAAIFYILFYAVVLYASSDKEKAMPAWMQAAMGLTNAGFYAATTSFVIMQYYSIGNLWIMVVALLLFNLAGLVAAKKYFPAVFTLPLHLVTMVLASLALPLMFDQNHVLLFTAMLSMLLLLWSKQMNHRLSLLVSLLCLGIMVGDYLVHWILVYLSAALFSVNLHSPALMGHATLSSTAVLAALSLNYWFVKSSRVSLPKQWISRTNHLRLVNGLILLVMFLTAGWLISSFLCFLSGSMEVATQGWYIAGSLFFILLLRFQSEKYIAPGQPMLIMALVFALSYPLAGYLSMMGTLDSLLSTGHLPFAPVVLHYLTLALTISLAVVTIKRIYRHFVLHKFLRNTIQLVALVFLLFILLTEYDNFSLLLSPKTLHPSALNLAPGVLSAQQQILNFNHGLPFSLILLFTFLATLGWALRHHQRFLRNLCLTLFTLTILKIFLYDFSLLGDLARTLMLILIGLLLLVISFLYPRKKTKHQ
ncbi:MAG: DUF2339 domain-containing protein [Bacteroidota bacterium]